MCPALPQALGGSSGQNKPCACTQGTPPQGTQGKGRAGDLEGPVNLPGAPEITWNNRVSEHMLSADVHVCHQIISFESLFMSTILVHTFLSFTTHLGHKLTVGDFKP